MDVQSAINFFKWSEIEKDGYIELNLIKQGCPTKKSFWDNPQLIIDEWFLDGSPIDGLLCVGVNPRVEGKTAHDKDIQIFKNLYIDIEPIHAPNTVVSEDELVNCQAVVDYILGLGVPGPLAYSGNGYHVLTAIPSYNNPQEFGAKLQTWYKTRLLPETKSLREKYRVRIDSTFSPSRQVKLYGTKKPIEGSRLSRFPAVERVESAGFRDYILSFPEKPKITVAVGLSLGEPSTTLEEIEEKYRLRG